MRRPLALLTAALALGAVAAAPASAATRSETTPIRGGATTLALDAAVAQALTAANISVAPIDPATASEAGIAFPITRGVLDDISGAGRLEHSGGLRIARGGASVALTDFIVTTTGRQPALTARVGNARVRIIEFDTDDVRVSPYAFGVRITGLEAELTRAAANALNDALDTRVFARGLELGMASVDARRARITVEGGDTRLAVDAGAAAALASLGVQLDLIGPAFGARDGALGFPISRGVLRGDLAGQIEHRGGIRLVAGDTELELTHFVIDTVRSVLTAEADGIRIDLLALDVSAGEISPVGLDDLRIAGVPGTLTATAAAELNAAFGVTAFTEGLRLGVATVSAVA